MSNVALPRAESIEQLPEPDDDGLMSLAAAGSMDAFARLVRRHESRIRGMLGRMVGAEDARDLAQDVFVSLWGARHRYQGDGRFVAFLYTIAINRVRREQRVRILRERLFARDDAALPAATATGLLPDMLLLRAADAKRVTDVVGGLPFDMRAAVVLRCAEGLDYQEIASITGAPEATVRSRVHRGLVMLRQRMGTGGGELR